MGKKQSLLPFTVLYVIFLAPVVTSLWEDFHRPQPDDGILPLNCSFTGFLVWNLLIHALYFGLRATCRVLGWKVRSDRASARRKARTRRGAAAPPLARALSLSFHRRATTDRRAVRRRRAPRAARARARRR